MNPIAELLDRRIGLDADSLGPTVLPSVVAERMRALGLKDLANYMLLLDAGSDEFTTLVDRLVVPETWFFRGAGLFERLAQEAAIALSSLPAGSIYRVLSVPCSTGEEPYSLAMAFLSAGLPVEQWQLDAIDLSQRHVDAARRGIYRELAFRETDIATRTRFFEPVESGWQISASVRDRVDFRMGNVLELNQPDYQYKYSLILCRNLLIYLTPTARQRALNTIESLLTPDGLLAVGHSEPQALAGRSFERLGSEPHFLFRRGASPKVKKTSKPTRAPTTVKSKPVKAVAPIINSKIMPEVENPLERVRRLADAGRLTDALSESQAFVRANALSADGYSLLGLIQQGLGNAPAATEAFRRALYLDPNHREALAHAMLFAERKGDQAWAKTLSDRLRVLGPGGES